VHDAARSPCRRQRGPGRYVVSLDIGIVNDRTVMSVMHMEETARGGTSCSTGSSGGRQQGGPRRPRRRPGHAARADDGLLLRRVVLDPHQAVLIGAGGPRQGVIVHEFQFTATSVGRLALSLHQAIRNHRVALPDDETLIDELASVRLRKNSLGVYRLDHDSGQHDDQAVALALVLTTCSAAIRALKCGSPGHAGRPSKPEPSSRTRTPAS